MANFILSIWSSRLCNSKAISNLIIPSCAQDLPYSTPNWRHHWLRSCRFVAPLLVHLDAFRKCQTHWSSMFLPSIRTAHRYPLRYYPTLLRRALVTNISSPRDLSRECRGFDICSGHRALHIQFPVFSSPSLPSFSLPWEMEAHALMAHDVYVFPVLEVVLRLILVADNFIIILTCWLWVCLTSGQWYPTIAWKVSSNSNPILGLYYHDW